MKIRRAVPPLTLCLLLIFAALLSRSNAKDEGLPDVRMPAVAGAFYPRSPAELRRHVTALLDRVPEMRPAGEILALVAPHAGYRFSGGVAAYTHKALATARYDTLVIIGHDTHRDAVAFTCPVDYFQTPLGRVPVDREMMAAMEAFHRGIRPGRALHEREHTVEVHLPFLQVLGKGARIVPLLFGNPTTRNCHILSQAILAASGKRAVLVLASVDMAHYPPYDWACKVDRATLEVLKSLDADQLFAHLAEQERKTGIPNLRTAMCAKGALGTAILFARARGANQAQVLRYANSGDVPGGDRGRVVGYASVLIIKNPAP